MAVALVMNMPGLSTEEYEAVMRELGVPLHMDSPNWDPEIISHAAGTTDEGLCVIDVWESRDAFDEFVENRLAPAFEKAGLHALPEITQVELHNTWGHSRPS